MNVANKMDKSVVKDSMKDENKIEIFASTRGKLYADAVRYDQNISCKKDNDFAKIYKELLVCDKSMSFDMDGSPPNLCTNLTEVSKGSNSVTSQKDFIELSSQDEELVSILEDLQHNEMPEKINVSSPFKDISARIQFSI